ncbi:MAG TPA: methyltransferase domain-containing protein [Pyrinomonadaceae bacterium]
MADYNEHYALARYYDIAFRRDVGREVDFINALFERRAGRALRSVLELGCGPGYHARAFARRGVRATGLDLRAEMIEFARAEAFADVVADAAEGANVEWMVGDMRDFRLAQPVDVVICVRDGIDGLLSNDDITRNFQIVAANLNPDGLYLIELTHPRDCSIVNYGAYKYEGERDGCRVTIDWGARQLHVDPQKQVVISEIQMHVRENGSRQTFSHRACERILFAQEIDALARLSGALAVEEWYGDFDLRQPFDNTPASSRMLAVLRPTARSTKTTADASTHSQATNYFSPKLSVRENPAKGGHSVFASEAIAAGEMLVVWGGRVVTGEELSALSRRERWHSLQVEENLYLAPIAPPEPGDFLCHSCEPNAGLSGQIALVAMRAIARREEVCFDYAMTDGSAYDEFDCACGVHGCRRRITGDDWRLPELQARYDGYFSPYLQRRINQQKRS